MQTGDKVRQADGTTGTVWLRWNVEKTQEMYNLTVDEAHTFFVGDGQWLVHNCADSFENIYDYLPKRNGKGPTSGYLIDGKGNLLLDEIIVSGNTISYPPASIDMVRDPSRLLPSNGGVDFLHHVESKAARYMQESNIDDAILVINNHPCSGPLSCSKWLEKILPQGSTLRVIVPDGFDVRGPLDILFRGK